MTVLLANVRARLLLRTPAPWRAAALVLLADRPIAALLLLAAAAGVLVGVLTRHGEIRQAQSILALTATALGIGLARGIISGDRTMERWIVLFQRGEDPVRHYSRVFLLTLSSIAIALALPALAIWISSGIGFAIASFSGSFLWAAVCLVTATGISSLVRRYDLEVMVILLLVSFSQHSLYQMVSAPAFAGEMMRTFLLPIDGVFGIWNWMVGAGTRPNPTDLLLTAGYPVAWTLVAIFGVRAIDRSIQGGRAS